MSNCIDLGIIATYVFAIFVDLQFYVASILSLKKKTF